QLRLAAGRRVVIKAAPDLNKGSIMTQPAPAPAGKSKLPLVLGGALVAILLAVGAYFLFLDERGAPQLAAVGQPGALVEAPAAAELDLQAFLDHQLTAEQKQDMS